MLDHLHAQLATGKIDKANFKRAVAALSAVGTGSGENREQSTSNVLSRVAQVAIMFARGHVTKAEYHSELQRMADLAIQIYELQRLFDKGKITRTEFLKQIASIMAPLLRMQEFAKLISPDGEKGLSEAELALCMKFVRISHAKKEAILPCSVSRLNHCDAQEFLASLTEVQKRRYLSLNEQERMIFQALVCFYVERS